MPSERVQRRIDRLLDDAEEAADRHDWAKVTEFVEGVLALDPDNSDAAAFREMAERAGRAAAPPTLDGAPSPSSTAPDLSAPRPSDDQPSSFASGRYTVSKFLGEGGKKRVYQAHDTLLDREVAFALIKTDGLDDASRSGSNRL